ncbi:MAG: EAL domain-containing protein [Hyphomicrobiaceae bacterium]|nr:EAL domain-containing protein [Hyphomicrobiaceae bacterium]
MQPTPFLTGLAMLLIAGSAGAISWRLGYATPLEAGLAGVTLFLLLGLLEQAGARRQDRRKIASAILALEERLRGLETDSDMLKARLLEGEQETQKCILAAVSPMGADLDAMGALIQQVSEVIADVDQRVDVLENAPRSMAASAYPASAPALAAPVNARDTVDAGSDPAAQQRSDTLTERLLGSVRASVKADRIEIALQPVVTLPQRRVKGYEVFARLELEQGRALEAREATPAAQAAGVIADFDRHVLIRAARVARRLLVRNPDILVFVNAHLSSLLDEGFCDAWKAIAADHPDLAGHFLVEFRQADLSEMTPVDHEMLGAVSDLGFRFSVDQVTSVGPGLLELARYGVRYAKVPAGLLLGRPGYTQSDIHPEDLADLLARHGMELIADEVSTEAEIVDILDCNPRLGQGYLFAAPRAVRSDPDPAGESVAEEPARPAPRKTPTPPVSQQPRTVAQPRSEGPRPATPGAGEGPRRGRSRVA